MHPAKDLIVIGASAGGIEALRAVVAGLPSGLPAAVLVVLHVPSDACSDLPRILSRTSRLPVAHARADGPLARGTIVIAPPDHHLTVRGETVHLSRGPRINRHRPAVDPLFLTAALALGPRVVGVVLSGMLDDGAAGMLAIKNAGGATIVQAPEDARHPGMPRSVLELMSVDRILPATAIAAALVELAGPGVPSDAADEVDETGPKATAEAETSHDPDTSEGA